MNKIIAREDNSLMHNENSYLFLLYIHLHIFYLKFSSNVSTLNFSSSQLLYSLHFAFESWKNVKSMHAHSIIDM